MTDPIPLPTPISRDDTEHGVDYYTADQMRAYAAAARAQALEEAARLIETNTEWCGGLSRVILQSQADAIRALKDKTQ